MNKENCALKLVDEIILYYDARSKKYKKNLGLNPKSAKCQKFLIYKNLYPSVRDI